MGLFNNLSSEGLEKQEDRVGGGGFKVLESDIYKGTIEVVYLNKAKSGAVGFTMNVKLDNGRDYRETIYVTNKNGENFFMKDKKKIPLPGFSIINDMCMIATETPLSEQSDAVKKLKVYDVTAKEEVIKDVTVLDQLCNKRIALAILHEVHNKMEKGDEGYVATAETRDVNTVAKVLHPELKLTLQEALEGKESTYWDKWIEVYKNGKPVDRRTVKENGGTAGRPKAPVTQQTPRQSIFGKK